MPLRAPAPCVLIVDDHADIRETLAEILEGAGYSVATAANGVEALAFLRENPLPGLILLDLMMPVMDGREFRHRMLEDPTYAEIPIAIISGADTNEQKGYSLEAVGYFVKPVAMDPLLQMVERHCRAREAGGSSGEF